MTISSLFTSNERLFAEWMMHLKFNKKIQAEPRFPGENADTVRCSYLMPKKPESQKPICPTKDEKEVLWKARLKALKLSIKDKSDVLKQKELEPLNKKLELNRMLTEIEKNEFQKEKTYQLAHGSMVQKIEKKSAVENVTYGDFWGRTRFTVTKKQTGYFLVDGWLVVSVPKKAEEKLFEINKEDEITVVHKLDESFGSVASSKINGYIQAWFSCESEKLSIVSAAGFSGATLFSALVPTLAKCDYVAGQLLALALVASCVAMAAMVIYSSVKLYNLYCLKEKMDSIQNLGDWVVQMRSSAFEYPDLFIGAHSIQKFFTSREQKAILAIDGYNRLSYIRRLFKKNPVVLSQVKV